MGGKTKDTAGAPSPGRRDEEGLNPVRLHKSRAVQLGASMAAIAMLAVGCSSSTSPRTSNPTTAGTTAVNPANGCPGDPPNQIYHPNIGGTPKTGGTLTVLGIGDVDEALDINIGYYTLDSLAYDLYNRPLYTYPSVLCTTFTQVPDIAAGPPVITNNGLNYAVTIRAGAMWDSTPPRQVEAADVVRGVKRSCNPNTPFGGQPDFNDVLAGYQSFCTGFGKVSSTSATAMAAYINANSISGVQVDPSNPLTVDFTLTKAAAYFTGALSLPPFNPAPAESLASVPASANAWQTVMSDGPYKIQSYSPGKTIVFVRNPAWNQSADPLDHAYVNEIDVSETGTQTGVYQQILTNSPQADMQWDVHVPQSDIPGLIASKDPRFQLLTESANNPYFAYNTVDPNNNGALKNVAVRQALEYAMNRNELVQDGGGPTIVVPLTHVMAPGTDGAGAAGSPDYYPYDPNKAKQMLAAAGFPHLALKFLYRQSVAAQKDFQTLQAQMAQIGVTLVGLGVPSGTFYGKYMNPGTPAKQGAWDVADVGWGPDWFPNGQKSWFAPILDGRNLPPNSSNYGLYNSPVTNGLIDQALAAPTDAAAATLWAQADAQVMKDAAIYPVYDPNEGSIEGSQVHNCINIQPLQNCNLANVWLSS
jgi:peptide/nickel transport system substrate-binding protein